MMEEIALEVKNISKTFKVHEHRQNTLKGAVSRIFSRTEEKWREFEVLKNISFTIHKGEALGVIGRNGAGKSTLLRILSGIMEPDSGEVNFYGRPVSILDVGAGFHPDLTGRENIYLSASLYKFTRAKIDERFEQIVSYSGIEEFIDQPVKTYSSGMYLRLAFSIITCLDADIYLMDEVINVGDANFQTKCKIRMEDLIAAGKTMLIASHNLNEITSLCDRVIMLEAGEIIQTGGSEVVQQYMTRSLPQLFAFEGKEVYHLKDIRENLKPAKGFKITECGIKDYKDGIEGISISAPFKVFFKIELSLPISYVIRLKVYDSTGALVFICSTFNFASRMKTEGNYYVEFELPANIFNERMYSFDFTLINSDANSLVLKVDKFLTVKMTSETPAAEGDQKDYLPGLVKPLIITQVEKIV
jgi:ABC-type polysaccharide/polyol phosphate transport system ATPase subunit